MSVIPLFISNTLGNTNSTGNTVNLQINPPINLDDGNKYYCGLISCSITNCNPNVIYGVNSAFVYGVYSGGNLSSTKTINLATGMYSLDEINTEIARQTLILSANSNLFILQGDSANSLIWLNINQTTGTLYGIDLTQSTLLSSLLGFTQKPIDITNDTGHIIYSVSSYVISGSDLLAIGALPILSKTKAVINSLSSYVITADFIDGGYSTNTSGMNKNNILYSCTPDVAPFSTIIRNVENVMFIRVNRSRLESIQINVLDQNMNNTDFTCGTYTNPEPYTLLLYIVPEKYLFKS